MDLRVDWSPGAFSTRMVFKGLGERHDGAGPGAPSGKETEGPHREGPAQREEDGGARARTQSLPDEGLVGGREQGEFEDVRGMRGWLTGVSRGSLKTWGEGGRGVGCSV